MFWGKRNDEELNKLRSACRTSVKALTGCRLANPDVPRACTNLETAAIACAAQRTCSEAHDEFVKCAFIAHGRSSRQGRLVLYADQGPCTKQIEAMRRCLERKRLWPALVAA
jgi:hypothetical protein